MNNTRILTAMFGSALLFFLFSMFYVLDCKAESSRDKLTYLSKELGSLFSKQRTDYEYRDVFFDVQSKVIKFCQNNPKSTDAADLDKREHMLWYLFICSTRHNLGVKLDESLAESYLTCAEELIKQKQYNKAKETYLVAKRLQMQPSAVFSKRLGEVKEALSHYTELSGEIKEDKTWMEANKRQHPPPAQQKNLVLEVISSDANDPVNRKEPIAEFALPPAYLEINCPDHPCTIELTPIASSINDPSRRFFCAVILKIDNPNLPYYKPDEVGGTSFVSPFLFKPVHISWAGPFRKKMAKDQFRFLDSKHKPIGDPLLLYWQH